MGVVLRARHLVLDRVVAIKLLRPEIATRREAVARFLREAQAATRIQSEHVTRVFDVATAPNGAPYIVMEYLEGLNLDQALERAGPLPITLAVDYVLQASVAIAEAHSLGIVHRDLKPANIFLTSRPDGRPFIKVLDFGISKMQATSATGPKDTGLTNASRELMGSPLYVSPEQMRAAKDVTNATDIWSLGVILYQLVSGEFPFEADTIPLLYASVTRDPPTPLSRYVRDLPQSFEAVVMRCLEKEPALRFQDIGELAIALAPFASPNSAASLASIEAIAANDAATVMSQPRVELPSPSSRAPRPPPMAIQKAGPAAEMTLGASAFEARRAVVGPKIGPPVVLGIVASLAVGILMITLFTVGRPKHPAADASTTALAPATTEAEPAPAVTESPEPTASSAPPVASAVDELEPPAATATATATATAIAKPVRKVVFVAPAPPPPHAPAASASAHARRYGGRE
jgi:serine/threonine-protein kinase